MNCTQNCKNFTISKNLMTRNLPKFECAEMNLREKLSNGPVDKGRKLNVHKTFRRRLGRFPLTRDGSPFKAKLQLRPFLLRFSEKTFLKTLQGDYFRVNISNFISFHYFPLKLCPFVKHFSETI